MGKKTLIKRLAKVLPGPARCPRDPRPRGRARRRPGRRSDRTKEELVAALGELNVGLDYAVEAAKALFPDRDTTVELTPAQRHELVESLRSEAAQAAL
jgi:hypothetical protein